MKIFFDTEFTGLYKDTELISIGLISETGDSFYAEITDYDKTKLDKWLKDNIIKNLILNNKQNGYSSIDSYSNTIYIKANKDSVKQALSVWLTKFRIVEWVSDVCHYDLVLLIDLLFGNALDMPNNISATCYDINQDISRYYNISTIEAFNKSREEILEENNINISGNKHNSLYDAKVIKQIYELLN